MIQIEKGKLAGHSLKELTDGELREFAHSALATEMKGCSFYKGQLEKVSFDGVTFIECNLARVNFTRVRFRNCKFERVDLTRAHFKECVFVDCVFSDSDPYYAVFESTEVDPFRSGIKLSFFSRTCERRLRNTVRHGRLVQLNTTLGCGSDVGCFTGGVLRDLRGLGRGFRAYASVR